jgi:hypothetical protein
LLAVAAIYLVVSAPYTAGPRWLVLAIAVLQVVSVELARQRARHRLAHRIALVLLGAVTALIVVSATVLLTGLLRGTTRAPALLRDGALMWVANILAFALWYWETDGGGPAHRHHSGVASTDFVFPQMTLDTPNAKAWRPRFVDYLFLAFNTSTAFSPTDTMVLARRAKLLMMAQSLVSLVTIAVIAARAINTL